MLFSPISSEIIGSVLSCFVWFIWSFSSLTSKRLNLLTDGSGANSGSAINSDSGIDSGSFKDTSSLSELFSNSFNWWSLFSFIFFRDRCQALFFAYKLYFKNWKMTEFDWISPSQFDKNKISFE